MSEELKSTTLASGAADASATRTEPAIAIRGRGRPRSQLASAWLRLRRNHLAFVGLVVLTLIVLMAVLAPVIAPYDPIKQDRRATLQAPSSTHLLGTDGFGRDVLSRMIYGSRSTLLISLSTVGIALLIGVPIGLIAGYSGGLVDSVLMRLMDTLLSFPQVLLALALLATLGPETRNVVFALAIVNLPSFARIARGSTLSVREDDYVMAARSIGAQVYRILTRHILPNVAAPIIVQASIIFATTMISAATLSFLGLGPQPPTPDWGRDISDGRRYIRDAQWLIIAPAFALSFVVLAVNFLGDGLRDALDPKIRKV